MHVAAPISAQSCRTSTSRSLMAMSIPAARLTRQAVQSRRTRCWSREVRARGAIVTSRASSCTSRSWRTTRPVPPWITHVSAHWRYQPCCIAISPRETRRTAASASKTVRSRHTLAIYRSTSCATSWTGVPCQTRAATCCVDVDRSERPKIPSVAQASTYGHVHCGRIPKPTGIARRALTCVRGAVRPDWASVHRAVPRACWACIASLASLALRRATETPLARWTQQTQRLTCRCTRRAVRAVRSLAWRAVRAVPSTSSTGWTRSSRGIRRP